MNSSFRRYAACNSISPSVSYAKGFASSTAPQPYGGQVFSESKVLYAIQRAMSWGHCAKLHLIELSSVVEVMVACAERAQGDEEDRLDLDEQFQRAKHQISQRIDGESGRFEAEATFDNTPLFLGVVPEGFTPIQLYTGYGRPGFPTLSFLARLGERPASSRVEGRAEVVGEYALVLDRGASSIEGVYEGKQISVRGERGLQITAVASYFGAERKIELIDPINRSLVGCCPYYCLESEICNRTLVGEGEVTVASSVWGGWGDQERRTALFDVEYGNLLTADAARAMLGRLQRVKAQLSKIQQKLESEMAAVQEERSLVDWMHRWERAGRRVTSLEERETKEAIVKAHSPLASFESLCQQN